MTREVRKHPPRQKDRSELRSILGFSIPMSVANYVQQSYLLADSIIVGHYVGIDGLAAVGAAQPIFYLVNAVFLGLVSGFAIRFARMTGAGRPERQEDAVIGLAAFAVVWAALCIALVFSATGFFLGAMGIQGTVAHGAETYLRTLSLGFVGIFGIGALGGFLRGLGDSRTVMYIMVFSSLLNIALAWSFVAVLGLWGCAERPWGRWRPVPWPSWPGSSSWPAGTGSTVTAAHSPNWPGRPDRRCGWASRWASSTSCSPSAPWS